MTDYDLIINMKDPTLLAELSEEDLEALRAMSDEDLAPPPSNEVLGVSYIFNCKFVLELYISLQTNQEEKVKFN